MKSLHFDTSTLALDNYYLNTMDTEIKASLDPLVIDDNAARNYSFNDNDNLIGIREDIIN